MKSRADNYTGSEDPTSELKSLEMKMDPLFWSPAKESIAKK